MSFTLNKYNLPPALAAVCKEDYHLCSLFFSNRLKFIIKKKKIKYGFVCKNFLSGNCLNMFFFLIISKHYANLLECNS